MITERSDSPIFTGPLSHNRIGWCAWAVLLAGVSLAVALVPERAGVSPVYRDALHRALAGENLYSQDGHGFLYLPISVWIFLPLLLKPVVLSEIVWRCCTVGIFAWGTYRLSAVAASYAGPRVFVSLSVVGSILALPGARAGQLTLAMAGLCMVALAEAARGHDRRAGIAAVGALLAKPLALPVVCLIGLCRLRSIPAMGLGIAVLLIFPFLLTEHSRVVGQYEGFRHVLTMTDKLSDGDWSNIAGLLKLFGMPLGDNARRVLSLASACLTACLCLRSWRIYDSSKAATTTYSLAMLWLVLFSPRAENNTYACIAPTIGLAIATGMQGSAGVWHRPPLRVLLYAVAAALIVGTYELGKIICPSLPGIWLAPLASSFIAIELWYEVLTGKPREKAPGQAPSQK
jgi:hypothetical protein